MAYDAILTCLADPTRRAILDRLRGGALPVGKIAEDLPVTRPAVSQHLKRMKDAGLVSVRPEGTRNLYALTDGGARPLVEWLGALRPAPSDAGTSVHVRLNPAEAWAMFTDGLATWWPVSRLSVSASESGALPMAVVFGDEAIRETTFDGAEHVWARIVEHVAADRLILDWCLDYDGRTEIRFAAEAGGCRVSVDAPDEAGSFWDFALIERFGAAARASLSNF
ncbi:ArsR/SmtB family transcription factor [Jannaschia aquimarina]|uniref:HTH-type transcriptional regulator n=2 Tax=Jannaschia aquimarina TaxID=935700 RepID=A0A0D1EG54_9RHOB|nr:metalloregulator ArsR/SmtB family transcription factor [Jannaschia aquimarina]KIT15876.1 HTH-type transcriptional regulator [Jannaschia aquimarina]SNS96809.1 DNA-binding transcriptional regulator, ArsR family [Jannaschia aquimarina]